MPHSLLTRFFICIFTLFVSTSNAQFPNNKLLGGNKSEFYTRNSLDGDGHPVITRQTSDGGYILVASTLTSANGDVTPTNHGGNDIWVVKFSANGTIEWQKLIGGNQDEYAFQVHQTPDGGYIIGANSNSSQSGDVTQTSRGDFDFWIIKLTSTGTISWNKLIGGSNADFLSDLILDSNGYVATGYSRSSKSGDITDTNKNDKDFWVVKISDIGEVSWNKLIGGDKTEGAFSILPTSEGGYLIGGVSDSNQNGDIKGTNHGYYDFWLVKLSKTGEILWDKLYGGLNYEGIFSMTATTNDSYILAGLSQSSSSGNVIGDNKGGYDSWVMKVDYAGNIVWTKHLGGAGDDIASTIIRIPDDTYVLAGYSNSSLSGDVTAKNHGDYDFWMTKFDQDGNILWNKLYGGKGNDRAYSIIRQDNGNFILSGISTSSKSGDITDENRGNTDLWILTTDYKGDIITQTTPSNAPIAHYPFNGNANDESGNGNNGTPSKAILTTDRFGKANSAYLFNGSDSRIDINKAFFDIGWNSFTISCWINSSSVDNANNYNNSQVILNTDPHNGIALTGYGATNPFMPEANNKYAFLTGSQPSERNWDVLPLEKCISKSNRTINTWNHLVVVKIGTTYSFYVNGVLDKSFVGLKTVPSNFCKMVLGNLASDIPNEGFIGKLDDFSIWNRELSQTEITTLYNSTKIETSQIDLSLTSKSLNQTVKKDSTAQISFTLKNTSSSKATNVKVLLKIPYSPPFVIKNSQNCTKGTFDSNLWAIPELIAGDSCVLNIIYQPIQSGVWYVEAEVFSADQEDADSTPKNSIDAEDDFTRACLTMPISVVKEPFGMQLILEDPKIVIYQWYKNGNVIQGENKNTLQITALGKYSYDSKTYKCPTQGCCPFIIEQTIIAPTCCSPLEYILERKN